MEDAEGAEPEDELMPGGGDEVPAGRAGKEGGPKHIGLRWKILRET